MKKIKLNEEQLVQELTPEQATQPIEASPTEVANAQAAPVEEAPVPTPEEAPVAAPAEEAPVEKTPEVAAAPIDEVPAGLFKAPVEGMVPSGWIFPEEMAAAVAQQTGDLEAASTAPDAAVQPEPEAAGEAPIEESVEDMDDKLDALIAQMRAADKDGNEEEVERCKTEMLKLLGMSLQEECEEKMEEKSVEEIVNEEALEPGEAHPEDRDDLDEILADYEADYEAEKAAIEEAHPSLQESIEDEEIEEPVEEEAEEASVEEGSEIVASEEAEEVCPECGKNPCTCEDGECKGCEAEEVVEELADDLEAAEEPAEVLDATADFLRKIFGDVKDEEEVEEEPEEVEDEEEFDFAKYFGNISDEEDEEFEESLKEAALHSYVFLFSDGHGATSRGGSVDNYCNIRIQAEDLNSAAAQAWVKFNGYENLEEWNAEEEGYEPDELEEIKANILGYIDSFDIGSGDPWVAAIMCDGKVVRDINKADMYDCGFNFTYDEDAKFWGMPVSDDEEFEDEDDEDEDDEDEEFEESVKPSELKGVFYPAGSKKAEESEDEVKAYEESSKARKAALNSFTEKINRKKIEESKKAFRSALNEAYQMTEEEAEGTWESKKLSEKEDRAFSWSEYLQKYNN